tara:strand:+ start:977 stop:1750 length:774 start_codon:yes stop_codon:yes gene_type:complete
MKLKKNKFIKTPKKNKSENFFKNYFKKHGLYKYLNVKTSEFEPDYKDLFLLHQYIILNKRLTVLEFGTGWSSLVIKHALNINKKKYSKQTLQMRKKNKFELFVIDNNKRYLKISKIRNKNFFGKKENTFFHFSECNMTIFNRKFASQYKSLPACNPDFIYLDGPSPFTVKKKINGFSTNHPDLMPMSCDILKFEHFLCPGTIILIDGRTANARFLQKNFQRNWEYFHDEGNDQNLFYLNEKPLGRHNKDFLKFYKKN